MLRIAEHRGTPPRNGRGDHVETIGGFSLFSPRVKVYEMTATVLSSSPVSEAGWTGGRSKTPPPPAPARILVVEDEQIVALELEERLLRAGYGVPAVVASAEEAIDAAELFRPDLVLMDIKLQGTLDGIDAAGILRRRMDLPVVYLTAFADDRTLERAKATEPYGYLLKPFRDRELHVAVEMALHRHGIARRLRESEAWRLALLRSAGSAILATGLDGRIQLMNPLAEALTGWQEKEAAGLPLDQVFHVVEEVERRAPPWQEPSRKQLVARDGASRPIESESSPIRDSEGHELGHVWVFRDISERKRLHDRRRFMAAAARAVASSLDQEKLLSELLGLIVRGQADLCAIHLLDPDDGTLRIRALAHGRADVAGLAARVLDRPVPRRGEGCVELALRGASCVQPAITGLSWLAYTLGIQEAEAAAAGLGARSSVCVPLAAFGEVLGAMTLVSERPDRGFSGRDVPFAEELGCLVAAGIAHARQHARAQRAVRMREDVLAIVSHDLKAPLQSICLAATRLARPAVAPPAETVAERARTIDRSARQMARLIDDLLDVARIDAGRLSLDLRPEPAGELLAEAAALFELPAAERGIALSVAAPPAGVGVLCDRDRVLQILSNLIGNALKLSPDGAPVRVGADPGDGGVHFQVTDRAGGIAPDQVGRVFEQYWQAPRAARSGAGLGLYITRGLVEAHGGRIWVDTTPGAGSTFHFTLPAAHAARDGGAARGPEVTG